MDMQPPKKSFQLLEQAALVDEIDDEVPTKEEFLHNLRESLRQSLAGETRPFDEWVEEIRRENGAEAEAD